MLGRRLHKALGMGCIGRVQVGLPAGNHRLRLPAMHHVRGQEGDASMMMFAVVPADEFGHQCAGVLDGGKTLGKLGAVLEGFELRLRVGIVVGDVRTAMGLHHPQIREQQRYRFARHRRSPVGMHGELTGGDVLLLQRLSDKLLGQLLGFLVGDHPADHVAAVDIEHDIEVEIGPGRRSFELGNIPTPELVDPLGEQFGLDVGAGSTGALGRSAVGFEQAIER